MASIAAADLANLHGPSVASRTHVYTYASPRIGNADWAKFFDSIEFGSISRVTRQKDPVPHLPPTESGYLHHAQEFGILTTGELVSCTNTGKVGETSDCMNGNFWWPDVDMHTTGYFNISTSKAC